MSTKLNMIKEPVLEPILRYLRFHKTYKEIDKQNITIADIGCGPYAVFQTYLSEKGIKIKNYIGIDPLINNNLKESYGIKLIRKPFNNLLPLKTNSVDFAVAHAVLEHVDKPKKLLLEMYRIVKPGGKILLTTPTPVAKYILEFLSYKLNLISKREIMEHKNYFDKDSLSLLLKNVKGIKINHRYFEFGLNNILVVHKN